MDVISALIKETQRAPLPFSDVYEPRIEPSPDTESAGTLTLDFPASRMAGDSVSCSDHPIYGILLRQPEQTQTPIDRIKCSINVRFFHLHPTGT